ncbi:TOBE domain-containing protein [Pseudomonas sp. nanlin1]|uniref:TOBE domain-containing protein n=1 Tax=Pseudomonas sp. nanlin1 TaxID=3040605 RepID=UPI003890D495
MPLPSLLSQHLLRRPQRIALLQHIAEQGSITRAAKSAGLSYKAAWDAIDELNNLANAPLVERAVGGKGGGGARLSAEGERVLRLYLKLQAMQAQVLEAAEQASDLDLLGRLMLRTSARNQLHGRVHAVQPQGRNDLLSLALSNGLQIKALITHDSTLRLELAEGAEAFALIKAGWVNVHNATAEIPYGQNCFQGRVAQVFNDNEGPCELSITVSNGPTFCALAEPGCFSEGESVQISIAPSAVLIGIAP